MATTVAEETLRSYLSIPLLTGARISSRRDRLAFCSNAPGRFEIFSLSLQDGAHRQLTNGELPRSPVYGLIWSRNDDKIVFCRDQNGDERHDLFSLSIASGNVAQLTEGPRFLRVPYEVSPDNRWLLYDSDQGVTGEPPQLDLWRLPLAGGAPERLTHHAQPVYPWYTRNFYRPDGKKIAYGAGEAEDPSDVSIFVSESDGSGSRLLHSTRPGSRDLPGGWSPDGLTLAISSDAFDRVRTGLLNVDLGEVRWLEAGPYDEVPVEFSPDGRKLLTLRTTGLRVLATVLDLDSGRAVLPPFNMSYTGEAAFSADGSGVVAVSNSSGRPNEVVMSDLRSGRLHVLWSPLRGSSNPPAFVAGEIVHYPSFDGRPIEALLLIPPLSEKKRPGPAIVNVHGGPSWQWFDEFDPVVQFMVSQGFVVLLPNIRGSIGYGAAFRDLAIGDLGGGDLKDLAASAEYLRSLPVVNPHRLGVTGVSYGGYLTYMAMTKQPEIWAAGSAEAGITDWLKGFQAQPPGMQHFARMYLGDPTEKAELWADRSPVNFVVQMRAPLRIAHGVHDARSPILHARLLRDALLDLGRREGVDFEYSEYSDEGHSTSDAADRLRSAVPMMAFFHRHLMRETPESESDFPVSNQRPHLGG